MWLDGSTKRLGDGAKQGQMTGARKKPHVDLPQIYSDIADSWRNTLRCMVGTG